MSYPVSLLSLDNYQVFYLESNDASQIYPEELYKEIFGGGIYNGSLTKFYTIHIFPQRYSNREKTLYYIQDATITFSYNNILNANKRNTTYEYLIITPDEFERPLKRLVEHKENMNLTPLIVTLDDIYYFEYFKVYERGEQEDIKIFIKAAIEE